MVSSLASCSAIFFFFLTRLSAVLGIAKLLSKFSLISGAHESHHLAILNLLTRVVKHLLSFVFCFVFFLPFAFKEQI